MLPLLYNSEDISDSQVKNEFYHAWDVLYERIRATTTDEVTFLEIGADKGLWSIMFFLVCEELKKTPVYVTATLINDNNDHYINKGYDTNIFLSYEYRNLNLYKFNESTWFTFATPQKYWIQNGVTYLLKFETLEEDFKIIQNRLQCYEPLPIINTSKHEDYHKYYTQETWNIINKLFEEDIYMFNYNLLLIIIFL